jgi:hypothetical protein
MYVYGEVDVYIHVLLTSALAGGEWSASRSGLFTPRELQNRSRPREEEKNLARAGALMLRPSSP